jgi:hypothetical protein
MVWLHFKQQVQFDYIQSASATILPGFMIYLEDLARIEHEDPRFSGPFSMTNFSDHSMQQ